VLDGSFPDCAGTLVAPNLVITALSCLAEIGTASYVCDGTGEPQPGGGGYVTGSRDPARFDVFVGPALTLPFMATPDARGVEILTDGSRRCAVTTSVHSFSIS